jgi:DNA primase
MALPASFLEELRLRTPLPALIGRKVKLVRSGRQYKACCPFHAEKSPSFYVYDNGFHCFGCGVHGDAISFVMQSEGIGFMEAVTRLAAEAGLEVPAPTPQAAEAERRRLDIFAVLAAAAALLARLLHAPEGAAGLAYLRGRDLTDQTIADTALGWAPGRGGALISALRADGIELAQLIEAGLATQTDSGPRAMFFDRVTFPIRDASGRVISFGARTLGDAQPKYLNGPDTPVFSKRRALYGLHRARAAARTGAAVIVVEGYMDVLRLHQSGFAAAVAPLGTALTVEQLDLLWQLSPAPILCFDGDKAGARAAARTLDLALPLAQPDRSLRVAALPANEDPDSLVRARGPAALQGVLDAATSLTDALYGQLRAATPGDGPEQRARLYQRLEEAARRIDHRGLAIEVGRALRQRFFAQAREQPGPRAPGVRPSRPPPTPPARAGAVAPAAERARILTAILLRHPDLLHDLEEAFALVDLPGQLERLRDAMRDWADTHPGPLDSASLITHLSQIGRAGEANQALADVPLPSSAAPDAMPAEAEARWWHIFNLLDLGGLNAQVEQAQQDFEDNPTEQTQRRLIALCTAREKLRSGDFDAGVPAE